MFLKFVAMQTDTEFRVLVLNRWYAGALVYDQYGKTIFTSLEKAVQQVKILNASFAIESVGS